MVKLLLFILLFTLSLTGCVTKPGVENIASQNCAPIYTKAGLVRPLNCVRNTPGTHADTVYSSAMTDTVDYKVQTGRYTVIKASPTSAQSNLLNVMITVSIPKEIETIDASVRYLLQRSGYSMPSVPKQNTTVRQILSKPLPEIHRKIGPMRLIDALTMLTTPAFELITDPIKREIKYQLKTHYHTTPGVES